MASHTVAECWVSTLVCVSVHSVRVDCHEPRSSLLHTVRKTRILYCLVPLSFSVRKALGLPRLSAALGASSCETTSGASYLLWSSLFLFTIL